MAKEIEEKWRGEILSSTLWLVFFLKWTLPSLQLSWFNWQVHGGTTYEDIKKKVEDAEAMATENETLNIDTVLFFDEANTTDALGMIKEVMVDRRVNGRKIGVGLKRLQFIAACNPYRKWVKI